VRQHAGSLCKDQSLTPGVEGELAVRRGGGAASSSSTRTAGSGTGVGPTPGEAGLFVTPFYASATASFLPTLCRHG
jgi:hypothetical protein